MSGLRTDRYDIAAVAKRDDRVLGGGGVLPADHRGEAFCQAGLGDTAFATELAEICAGRIEDISARGNCAVEGSFEGGQIGETFGELEQSRESCLAVLKAEQCLAEGVNGVERVRDHKQLWWLEAGLFGGPVEERADIASTADGEVGMVTEQGQGFLGDVEQVLDLARFCGRAKFAGAFGSQRELAQRSQPIEDGWQFKFCNGAIVTGQDASPGREALNSGLRGGRSGTRAERSG